MGRVLTRPILASALGFLAVLVVVAISTGAEGPARSALSVLNPGYTPAADSVIEGVRHVYTTEPREHLVLDTIFPDRGVSLLWFQGYGVSTTSAGGGVTLDGGGGAVRFDDRLNPHRIRLRLEGREPTSVAARKDGEYWVVDTKGTVHRVDAGGEIVRSTPTGFAHASAVTAFDGGAWISRSSQLFAFRLATQQDPLLVRVSADGDIEAPMGSVVLPSHILLAEIANAGHVTTYDGVVYFAPFIRDEVVAFSPTGDTLWIMHRGLPQTTVDPRIEIGDDGPVIDYAPVNLGIATGPDGLLYVLSVPGFTTSASRIDVLDPEDGTLLRSVELADPLPTIAADSEGRVYQVDPFRLLTGVAPTEREPLASFDLDRMNGSRMLKEDLRGKVVLINFWASWCLPCREEMPALDSLRRSITHDDFLFITMNEDIAVADARSFIDEFGFDFPVLLGKGKLQAKFHYYGLPYTVAVDREGRVLQRWIGYAGEDQLAGIRAVIQAELIRRGNGEADGEMRSGEDGMQHHNH
jgi:thiol-disulfide isomerase/thioredoxin